jgi:hypothetical protein
MKFLDRIVLAKVRKHSSFFITEKDLMKLRFIGNSSLIVFILFFVLFHFLTQTNIILTAAISLIIFFVYVFVFGDYIRSTIIKRHQLFDESAFLIINSLSINMISLNSFPKSIEFLFAGSTFDDYYRKYFQNMLFNLNLGEDETTIIEERKEIFLNKQYQNAFQNIMREDFFVDSDPDFLFKIKKTIKLIEDNIIIFIAFSCLFPLVLSLVLALILPANSLIVFVFPLLYSLFGSFALRFIQNKSLGDKNG